MVPKFKKGDNVIHLPTQVKGVIVDIKSLDWDDGTSSYFLVLKSKSVLLGTHRIHTCRANECIYDTRASRILFKIF